MTRFTQMLLVFVLLFNSGCIHLASTEHKTLELKSQKNLREIAGPTNLRITSLIYTDNVYPLETFLKKLLAGDFNEAVRKVNLAYTPSNVDNQLISELINEGLIPVYVKIENTSADPIEINEKNFVISDDHNQIAALTNEEIPRAFTRFNSKAVAANAFNVGAVAIVYVGVLIAVGIVSRHGGTVSNFNFLGASSVDNPSNPNSYNVPSKENDNRILNRTDKTTVIDYQNYLLGKKTIPPYSIAEGLLFFRFKSPHSEFKLIYR